MARHRRDIAQHLDLIPGQLREREAHRDIGLAVVGSVVLAGGELDHGVLRWPHRNPADVFRALPGPLRTGLAPRRALRGLSAVGAFPLGPPPGVEPSGGCVLLLRIAPALAHGARCAGSGAVEGPLPATGAETGNAPRGIEFALGGLAGFTARLAGRAVRGRGPVPASGAQARFEAFAQAPPTLLARHLSALAGVAPAVLIPSSGLIL